MTEGTTHWLHKANREEMLKITKEKEMSQDIIIKAAKHGNI